MNVIVKDPNGVVFGEKVYPKGSKVWMFGGQLKAYLHFKQVEETEGESPTEQKPAQTGLSDADVAKAAKEKAVADFQERVNTRGAEISKLNRKEQVKLLEKLGLVAPKDAKEDELIERILNAEFAKEKEALALTLEQHQN